MPDNSFDVVSQVEMPEVVNAIQQTLKEVHQRYDLKDSGAKAIVIVENFAATLQKVMVNVPAKQVIVTALGDMLGFPKALIVNYVVRKVKKMVPPFELPGAVRFNDALAQGREFLLARGEGLFAFLDRPLRLRLLGGQLLLSLGHFVGEGVARLLLLAGKSVAVLFQFAHGEISPFVVVIAEEAGVPEETLGFRVIFRGVPGTGAGGIEELGHHNGIFHILLPADCRKPLKQFAG